MIAITFIFVSIGIYAFVHRIALLQRQLLEVRDKIGYAKFQHSRKSDGPSEGDKQELYELEARERSILDKIADEERRLEVEKIFDDSIAVAYKCDQCKKTIEGTISFNALICIKTST